MNLASCAAGIRLIATLRDLDLTTITPHALAAILVESNVEINDFEAAISFTERRYTRTLLYRNDDFELLLLCWGAGSQSPIHDHGGMRCAVKILAGELEIKDYLILTGGDRPGYALIAPLAETIATAGDIDMRMPNRDVHRVRAIAQPAVSLHVYAKPIDNFLIFDEANHSCRMAVSSYDSVRNLGL